MIPPLAVTPPPEPATVPPRQRGDRFAGALASAMAYRTRRADRSANVATQDAAAFTEASQPPEHFDADAMSSEAVDPGNEAELPDEAATVAVAVLVEAIAGGVPTIDADAGDAPNLGSAMTAARPVPGVAISGQELAIVGAADQGASTAAIDSGKGGQADAAPATCRADATAVDPAAVVGASAGDTRAAAGEVGAPAGRTGARPPDDAPATVFGDLATSTSAAPPAIPDGGPPPRQPAATPAAGSAPVETDGMVSGGDGGARLAAPAPVDLLGDDQAADDARPGPARAGEPAAGGPNPATGVPPVVTSARTTGGTHAHTPAPAIPSSGSATIAASDTIRFLRELGPARAVQRLAVDLDGAMVAVRVDQTGATPVRVQIVDDPAGRLDRSWIAGVERTLSQSMARHGTGEHTGQHRRQPIPHPDDAQPPVATGRRWADALGEHR